MQYSYEFGAIHGDLVFYFHGVPGSTVEGQIFQDFAQVNGLQFICLDRFCIDLRLSGESYYQQLADSMVTIANGKPFNVIGFSIGAFIASRICCLIPQHIKHLHLVSPASPLYVDDFFRSMAGKHVFLLARNWPWFFRILTRAQKILALFFPFLLFKVLFANAKAADAALAKDTQFQAFFCNVLRHCFIKGEKGYLRDIQAYVNDKGDWLHGMLIPTHLWHGTQDNWSVASMSQYLKKTLPHCIEFQLFDGLSHYSCLYASAPIICKQLGLHSNGTRTHLIVDVAPTHPQ